MNFTRLPIQIKTILINNILFILADTVYLSIASVENGVKIIPMFVIQILLLLFILVFTLFLVYKSSKKILDIFKIFDGIHILWEILFIVKNIQVFWITIIYIHFSRSLGAKYKINQTWVQFSFNIVLLVGKLTFNYLFVFSHSEGMIPNQDIAAFAHLDLIFGTIYCIEIILFQFI